MNTCTCIIKLQRHTSRHAVAVAYPGGELPTPRNPGKFAKDGEQPRPQPAIRIDSSRKL